MLTVCTSSTETQLATLGDLQSLLGATASSSGMDFALTAASRWVERYIGNDAGYVARRQVYTETVAGYDMPELMVSRTPVWGVQRLFYGTDTGTATEYCSTDFRIADAEAGLISFTNDRVPGWDAFRRHNVESTPYPRAVDRSWLIVYEAGWQLNETSSTGTFVTTSTHVTMPEDVQYATLLMAQRQYEGGGRMPGSMKVGPLSINYSSGWADDADPVMALLARYRRL